MPKSPRAPSLRTSGPASRNDPVDHLAMDIGQTHVAAAEPKRQPLVIDAEEMQHCRVQIVHLQLVLHDLVSPFVRLAKGNPGLGPAAGEPDGESELVMIAAVRSLSERRAPELACPDDECVLQ